jgi:hypothetical protein
MCRHSCLLLASVGLIVLAGCAASKKASTPSVAGPLKLSFPQVNGWHLSEPRQLPPESGGYSVAYNSDEKIAVTVYVYNRGLAQVPDDLANPVIERELASAKEAIQEVKRKGLYQDAREEESKISVLGGRTEGPKTLYARFRIIVDQQETLSELYVFPFQNHIIKLRVTRPAKENEQGQASLDRLYGELAQLFAK